MTDQQFQERVLDWIERTEDWKVRTDTRLDNLEGRMDNLEGTNRQSSRTDRQSSGRGCLDSRQNGGDARVACCPLGQSCRFGGCGVCDHRTPCILQIRRSDVGF